VQSILVAIILINALVTAYLFSVVQDQNRRIQILERDDQVKQSIDTLNTKYNSLKDRVQRLFH